jgi:hypothetical protein
MAQALRRVLLLQQRDAGKGHHPPVHDLREAPLPQLLGGMACRIPPTILGGSRGSLVPVCRGGVAVGHVLFLARTAPTVAKATFRKKVNVMVGS